MDRRMETLSSGLEKLVQDGYREQFRAVSDGLMALNAQRTYAPEDLEVQEMLRFEGMTDVGDESVLYALRARSDGTRGTYVVAYGPDVDPLDAKMVPRLVMARDHDGDPLA